MRVWYEFKRLLGKPLNIILIILLPVVLTIASIIFFNGFGVTSIKLGVYNLDNSPLSKFTIKLVMSFFKGGTLTYVDGDYSRFLQNGELNAVMVIPENFTDALYKGEKVNIDFIPSPVDLQLSVGIYNVLNSVFNDLSGSPFFNPQVLRYLFVSNETPAPSFVPKTKNFKTDFGYLFSPAILFLSVIFIILSIGVLTVVNDRDLGLISIFKVNNEKWYVYGLNKFLALFFLGLFVSIAVYIAGIFFGNKDRTIYILTFIHCWNSISRITCINNVLSFSKQGNFEYIWLFSVNVFLFYKRKYNASHNTSKIHVQTFQFHSSI
ncbi:conserved hypothetical protein [Thermosipho africanus TCF52B]|uniref:ABC-2 type transporter transmembrane domain-containing protein n=1 Tax=Thermosipho africanus (strain TCF52B) TaxID=484019 RepID=B7IGM7_THEAB|nr:conserved hypothetical protein [Thermosipho africanus TCF52B]